MLRWQQIVNPLREYESKKAGNSVSLVESFLLTDLPAVNLENCLSELSKPTHTRPPKDFFSGRRKEIRDLLFDRCAALASTDLKNRYATLRRIFNRDLAGRFPFAKYEPGNRIEDASPEVVRQFLKSAHDFRTRYRGLLGAKGSSSTAETVRFLDKLEEVHNFLMPMWAQAEAASDGFFETKVDFRTNQLREIGGNQIAEWAMRIGEERLMLGGPKPETTFRIGDPVRVELRWAKNSADVPSPEQGPTVTAAGRNVTFEEGGEWALLRMIAGHKSAEQSKGKGESGGNVLSFVVYIVPDPEGGYIDRAPSGSVRVFLRVGLRGNEKDKQLEYPEFPILAPSLTF
jgi:type VI secretion system protein ImpL